MSGVFLIPLYLSTSFYFHLRIITSWPWETGSILSEPLWCWNLPTRCQHSNFLTNHWASWGDSHIPRSWEAGYNLFDLRDQLGSASQQLNTGYTIPRGILTCLHTLTLTQKMEFYDLPSHILMKPIERRRREGSLFLPNAYIRLTQFYIYFHCSSYIQPLFLKSSVGRVSPVLNTKLSSRSLTSFSFFKHKKYKHNKLSENTFI